MLSEDLRPQNPPERRDVVVAVLKAVVPESSLAEGVRIKRLMIGLGQKGLRGAESFTPGGAHRAILETYANLQANGLMHHEGGLTPEGMAYAELVDEVTTTAITWFVAGAEHMEERHRNC